jgi:exopolyphosphatase/guanosine-5'-triphosphate,3'-diphosphate pyrophosphatase
LKHDPPAAAEIEKLKTELHNRLSVISEEKFTQDDAIAIAGTPTTLACIQKGLSEFDEEAIEGSLLKLSDLEKLINELSVLRKNKIFDLYKSVVKGREDVLLAGTIILLEIMKLTKLNEVIVSTKGIRYGAVLEYIIRD